MYKNLNFQKSVFKIFENPGLHVPQVPQVWRRGSAFHVPARIIRRSNVGLKVGRG